MGKGRRLQTDLIPFPQCARDIERQQELGCDRDGAVGDASEILAKRGPRTLRDLKRFKRRTETPVRPFLFQENERRREFLIAVFRGGAFAAPFAIATVIALNRPRILDSAADGSAAPGSLGSKASRFERCDIAAAARLATSLEMSINAGYVVALHS